MPVRNRDLHGSAPDKCALALLLIDVINDLDFPKAEGMLKDARKMARNLLQLKRRTRKAGVPVIYVNDNFGKWKSDFRRTIEHCQSKRSRGRAIAKLLQPAEDDYFVLKPKHSGFFPPRLNCFCAISAPKPSFSPVLPVTFACFFTANDAYVRDYELFIPEDCCVSNTPRDNNEALALMRKFLKADTRAGDKIPLRRRTTKRRKDP